MRTMYMAKPDGQVRKYPEPPQAEEKQELNRVGLNTQGKNGSTEENE